MYDKIRRFDGIVAGIISRKIKAIEIFLMPKLQGLYQGGEKQECVTFSEKMIKDNNKRYHKNNNIC